VCLLLPELPSNSKQINVSFLYCVYSTAQCATAHSCEGVPDIRSTLILWFPLTELKSWPEKYWQREKSLFLAGNTPQSIKQSMLFQVCLHMSSMKCAEYSFEESGLGGLVWKFRISQWQTLSLLYWRLWWSLVWQSGTRCWRNLLPPSSILKMKAACYFRKF
jgi:hypothetical protein